MTAEIPKVIQCVASVSYRSPWSEDQGSRGHVLGMGLNRSGRGVKRGCERSGAMEGEGEGEHKRERTRRKESSKGGKG